MSFNCLRVLGFAPFLSLIALMGGCMLPPVCREIGGLERKVVNSSGVMRQENEEALHATRTRCQMELAGLGQRELAKKKPTPTFRLEEWLAFLKQGLWSLRSWSSFASTFGP
jgi:hypothetical protein